MLPVLSNIGNLYLAHTRRNLRLTMEPLQTMSLFNSHSIVAASYKGLVCEEMSLLGGTMFALDGCKLPANASKEWSGTLPELHKKKAKIEAKVAQLLTEQMQDAQNDNCWQLLSFSTD